MYYVYFLKSIKYNEIYVGSTNDLRRRLFEHNNGVELSTKRYKPWRLVYYEAYSSEKDAREREMRLKNHGNAIRELKKRIRRSLQNGAGFTLIELLVTISIIGILVTIGVASYNNFNKRQTLKGAALTFKNDLRSAQSKAMAGEKTTPVGGECTALEGYAVRFPTATTYAMRERCNGPTGQLVFGESTYYSLPQNISFSSFPSSIIFKVLGQGVTTAQTICLSGFNLTYKISVTSTGEIKDEGFVACP